MREFHIALLAGEVSGDLLAAPLMEELRKRLGQVRFSGLGGVHMQAAGLKPLGDMDTLSVMGLFEVLKDLPAIFRLKRTLLEAWQKDPPDLFIGIDAPDFNLRIEEALRKKGIKTVHYVSPSLWAWKEKRIFKVKKAVDLMLCLFPFEFEIYERHGVLAKVVGHPMRDRLQKIDKVCARRDLDLPEEGAFLGLFAGSRRGEIERLLPIFLRAMTILQLKMPNLRALISVAKPHLRPLIVDILREYSIDERYALLSDAPSDLLMSASDVLMLSSGTITLEAALLERPMLAAYCVHPITAMLARRLLKIDMFSLPNLLAGRRVIHEWIQEDCTPEHLAEDALALFMDKKRREEQFLAFQEIKAILPKGVSSRAADAVCALLLGDV